MAASIWRRSTRATRSCGQPRRFPSTGTPPTRARCSSKARSSTSTSDPSGRSPGARAWPGSRAKRRRRLGLGDLDADVHLRRFALGELGAARDHALPLHGRAALDGADVDRARAHAAIFGALVPRHDELDAARLGGEPEQDTPRAWLAGHERVYGRLDDRGGIGSKLNVARLDAPHFE